MEFRYFLPRSIKKFSLKNEEKTKRRKWSCLIDENTHVHLHMSFIHKLLFFTFFYFFFPSSYMLPPLFILSFLLLFFWTLPFLSFFFFPFDLLGRNPVYVAHFFFWLSFVFLFFFCFCFCFYFFLFRCDLFLNMIFIFLINLGDFFLVVCHFFFLF